MDLDDLTGRSFHVVSNEHKSAQVLCLQGGAVRVDKISPAVENDPREVPSSPANWDGKRLSPERRCDSTLHCPLPWDPVVPELQPFWEETVGDEAVQLRLLPRT